MSAYEFELVAALRAAGASVSTAESCTGGLVAARITSVSGASEAFKYGAVTRTEGQNQRGVVCKADLFHKLLKFFVLPVAD